MTYICGQWVDTCEEWSRQTEPAYRIVAPTLPANGDYSAYNEWGSYLKLNKYFYNSTIHNILNFYFSVSDKNRDYAFNQTFAEPNPACTISAALTYTSQFTKELSFFLDVFLPRRPNFRYYLNPSLVTL